MRFAVDVSVSGRYIGFMENTTKEATMTESEIERAVRSLSESAKHWERIRDWAMGEHPITEQCACCVQYRGVSGCGGCPIKRFTGQEYCHDTPYWGYKMLWDVALEGEDEMDVELRRYAQEMVDFLEDTIAWTRRRAGD